MKKNPNATVTLSVKVEKGVYKGYLTTTEVKNGEVVVTGAGCFIGKARKKKKKRWTDMAGYTIWGSGKDNSQSVAPYSTKDVLGSIELSDLETIFSTLQKSPKFSKPGAKSAKDGRDEIIKALMSGVPSFVPNGDYEYTMTNGETSDSELNSQNETDASGKKRLIVRDTSEYTKGNWGYGNRRAIAFPGDTLEWVEERKGYDRKKGPNSK